MKKLLTLGMIIAMISGSLNAQTTVDGERGKGRGNGKHSGKDLNLKAVRMAIEEITKGNRILRDCLPIYNGHRTDAIKYAEIAKAELKIGIMEQKLGYQSTENPNDKDNKSKYTNEQIKRSNVQMVIAARHFENAISLLNRSNWSQVQRKQNAITNLQKALQELRAALAPYGGPDAYQKEAGNRGRINP